MLLFRYKDGSPTDNVYLWLWQSLEQFTTEEKSLFLRFVSGQSRLSTKLSDISQRFQISKGGRVSQYIYCLYLHVPYCVYLVSTCTNS